MLFDLLIVKKTSYWFYWIQDGQALCGRTEARSFCDESSISLHSRASSLWRPLSDDFYMLVSDPGVNGIAFIYA